MIEHLWAAVNGQRKDLFIVNKKDCDYCDKKLSKMAVHYFNIDNRFGEKVFCFNCLKDIDKAYLKYGQPELRTGVVQFNPPINSYPILSPTEFTYSRTIQEVMDQHHDGVQVIDRTVWAGRDLQLDGTEIVGKSLAQLEQEEGWKEDALDLLDFHMVATPVLPFQEEKKRLR